MANILGILAFALGIGITIALHEAGHMVTARAFGTVSYTHLTLPTICSV